MSDENVKHTKECSKKGAAHGTDEYDPFVRGRFPVGVHTIQGLDTVRDRRFPCEILYSAAAQHAGQDIASGIQDSFTVPSNDTPRGQLAGRRAEDFGAEARDIEARPPGAIISIAQQARPNVIGQIADLRAQLKTWSTVVVSTLSSNRRSSKWDI